MSLLVIKLAPRDRLGARAAPGEAAASPRLPQDWAYVFSADGRQAGPMKRAPLALLPKADQTVAVLAETDVSWHRVAVPQAAGARLRAALAGRLEELLLDEDDALHVALGEGAGPGKEAWVAVTHRHHLAAALEALDSVGLSAERVVSALPQPSASVRGHFAAAGALAPGHAELTTSDTDADGELGLALSREDGAVWLPLMRTAAGTSAVGGLAAAYRPASGDDTRAQRWTTSPAAALAAERYLGRAVALQTDAEHLLERALSAPNLRQFDLVARHRGMRAAREAGRRLLSAEWRLVRWGLAALLAMQLVGLNAYAWQQRQAVAKQQAAMHDLLRSAHPGVRTILDAPVQMATETERLRLAAGKPGEADFEILLSAAAAAWPEGKAAVNDLRFEPGRLVLTAPGWVAADVTQMRDRLRVAGFAVESAEGRLSISRLPAAGSTAAAPAANSVAVDNPAAKSAATSTKP